MGLAAPLPGERAVVRSPGKVVLFTPFSQSLQTPFTGPGESGGMKRILAFLCLLLPLGLLAETPHPDDEADTTESPYFVILNGDEEGAAEPLPLKHTEVVSRIAGTIAEVEVRQQYRNTGGKVLEAVYVFPGSTRAAVHGLEIAIGERRIAAKIAEREAAKAEYEKAKAENKTAALLEQERPNVFRMSVGHILPGDDVEVVLRYTELLRPEDGLYEFVFPNVVGPRYGNGTADGNRTWTANPHLLPGVPTPATLSIHVELAAGMPVREAMSPSHRVKIDYDGPDRLRADLETRDGENGDRDFVLQYRLAGDEIASGLLLHEDETTGENYFLLTVQPPARVKAADIPGRDYVFVVDVSGSMNGFPLDTAKKLLRDLIGGLRPTDRFNVLLFAGDSRLLAETPLAAGRGEIERALSFLDAARGGGGTELGMAMERALALPVSEGYSRSLILVTDGYVDFERSIFRSVRERLGQGNLFPLGIGSSVNRFLIEGLARAGRGEPLIVLGPDEAPAAAEKLREMIASPVLTNVAIDFGKGFEVHSVSPGAFPDVFAQRPLSVFGKFRGKPGGEIRVSGIGGGGRGISLDLPVTSAKGTTSDNPALRFLWARSRIAELADDHTLDPDSETKKEVTLLGLTHGLLTEFTSFVAVDTEVRASPEGAENETVRQPLPLPQGVPASAVGGGTVPEPATFLLWLTGMGAYACRRFFGKRRKES